MVFGGDRRPLRLGQHWDAVVATLVILCANILLREAAQRINLQPHQQATDLELCYRIQVTCGEQDEILVRTLILQALNGVALRLQSLRSADISSPGQLEVCAEITATPAAQKEIEGIVCRVSPKKRECRSLARRVRITGLINLYKYLLT